MRLTATNVGKKIKGKTVLSNIDLDLKSGNIYGFVGPNGSGKTMLFRALSGLMSVTSGVVKLDEKIVRKDFSVLPNLGILLENVSLYPNLTGYENLLYLAKFSGKAGKSEYQKHCNCSTKTTFHNCHLLSTIEPFSKKKT